MNRRREKGGKEDQNAIVTASGDESSALNGSSSRERGRESLERSLIYLLVLKHLAHVDGLRRTEYKVRVHC